MRTRPNGADGHRWNWRGFILLVKCARRKHTQLLQVWLHVAVMQTRDSPQPERGRSRSSLCHISVCTSLVPFLASSPSHNLEQHVTRCNLLSFKQTDTIQKTSEYKGRVHAMCHISANSTSVQLLWRASSVRSLKPDSNSKNLFPLFNMTDLSALVTMAMPCCSLKRSFPLSISKDVFVLHVWCHKHYTALSNSQLFSDLLVDWWLPVVAGSIWTFVERRRSSDLLSCRTMQTRGRRSHSKVLEALVSVDTAAVDIIEPDADQSEQILISRSARRPDESPPVSDCFLYVYLIRASLSLNHTRPWLIFISSPSTLTW